jgi:dTDP-4-dehydrorhamnose reductase
VAPDIIVNAAAYTAVDKAESERDLASLVNTQAPAVLAQEAKKRGAWFVHYSTDYVFDGSGENPWRETDVTNPVNFYGVTKRDGENAVRESGCRHLIFRTSWLYAAHGNNFPKTMLRLAKERDALRVVDDQIGAPTSANLIADVTARALEHVWQKPGGGGLYHLSATGETSWYDYARFVLDFARQKGCNLNVEAEDVIPISSRSYPLPAQRPLNSRLNADKTEGTFQLTLPPWQEDVARMLVAILPFLTSSGIAQ